MSRHHLTVKIDRMTDEKTKLIKLRSIEVLMMKLEMHDNMILLKKNEMLFKKREC